MSNGRIEAVLFSCLSVHESGNQKAKVKNSKSSPARLKPQLGSPSVLRCSSPISAVCLTTAAPSWVETPPGLHAATSHPRPKEFADGTLSWKRDQVTRLQNASGDGGRRRRKMRAENDCCAFLRLMDVHISANCRMHLSLCPSSLGEKHPPCWLLIDHERRGTKGMGISKAGSGSRTPIPSLFFCCLGLVLFLLPSVLFQLGAVNKG